MLTPYLPNKEESLVNLSTRHIKKLVERSRFEGIWLKPHWCTRYSLFESARAKSLLGSAMGSLIFKSLTDYFNDESERMRQAQEQKERETSLKHERQLALGLKIGQKLCKQAYRTLKEILGAEGGEGLLWGCEDEDQRLSQYCTELCHQINFVEKGIKFVYDDDTDSWSDVGVALPVSAWSSLIKSIEAQFELQLRRKRRRQTCDL